ncbi:hypothetical protein INT45_011787 [Circinella minor]|uniref:Uncharacterized protein n=1 Tax=Circinella minor TaxID=1195481 RepID=A0A8H7SAI5_9FUNG|nr:hypothetical protein INT45_011787 [Circinella minor]
MFSKRRKHLENHLFNAEEATGSKQIIKRSRILDPIDLPPSDTESIDEGGAGMRSITTQQQTIYNVPEPPEPSIQPSMTIPREERKSSGSIMTTRRSLMEHEIVTRPTIIPPEPFSLNHEPPITRMIKEEEGQDIDLDSVFSDVDQSVSLAGGEGFSFARSAVTSVRSRQPHHQIQRKRIRKEQGSDWAPMDDETRTQIDRIIKKTTEYSDMTKKRIQRTLIPANTTAKMFDPKHMEDSLACLETETKSQLRSLIEIERNTLAEEIALEDDEKELERLKEEYQKELELAEKYKDKLSSIDSTWSAPAPRNDYVLNLWKCPSSKFI